MPTLDGSNGTIDISKDPVTGGVKVTITEKGPPQKERVFRAKDKRPPVIVNNGPQGQTGVLQGIQDGECTMMLFFDDKCPVVVKIFCSSTEKPDYEFTLEGLTKKDQEKKDAFQVWIDRNLNLVIAITTSVLGGELKATLSAPGEVLASVRFSAQDEALSTAKPKINFFDHVNG
jgi:hypothetical protein